MLPDANLLFSGDYTRQGADLWISRDGAPGAIVEGYFQFETLPPLTSPSGAKLSGDAVEALAGSRTPGQTAQAGTTTGAEAIGQVENVEGDAFAIRTDGTQVKLAVGTPVFQGDVVETKAGAKLGLSFLDDTVFSLSENARMVLDELVYTPGGTNNSMLFNLIEGGFVFVAGEIAPTGDMRVATPVATLGIRGTSPTVFIARDGEVTFSIVRDPGPNGEVGSYQLFDFQNQVIGEINDISRKLILASPTAAALVIEKSTSDFENDRLFEQQVYSTFDSMRSRSGPIQTPDNPDGQRPFDGGKPEPDGEYRDGTLTPDAPFRAALEGGRPGDELILGREFGDNFLSGGRGDDIIFGGIAGDDFIRGGRGDDIIIGGVFGIAIISGGPGDDLLIGSEFGDSYISGGDGNDTIIGNLGDDVLSGDAGEDTISGGRGRDILDGGLDDDDLDGEEGNDALSGGPGNDFLQGGKGNDLLSGDEGNDDIFGGPGDDILRGGLGNDRFGFEVADVGIDVILDFNTNDFLDIDALLGPGYTTATASDFVSATEVSGNTVIAVDGDGSGTSLAFEVIAILNGVTAGTSVDYTIDGLDTVDSVVVA